MEKKLITSALRMVHIANVPHILQYGIVRKDSPYANPNYVPIGDVSVIGTRKNRILKDGSCLSDYIPFYFGPRSPMLYVIQNGFNNVEKQVPENIVYCVIKLEDLIHSDIECIFSDGHALNAMTNFYSKERLKDIGTLVSYADVYERHWNPQDFGDETKRKKEAELLVKSDIPVQMISGFVVYNQAACDKLISWGIAQEKIFKIPNFYY